MAVSRKSAISNFLKKFCLFEYLFDRFLCNCPTTRDFVFWKISSSLQVGFSSWTLQNYTLHKNIIVRNVKALYEGYKTIFIVISKLPFSNNIVPFMPYYSNRKQERIIICIDITNQKGCCLNVITIWAG